VGVNNKGHVSLKIPRERALAGSRTNEKFALMHRMEHVKFTKVPKKLPSSSSRNAFTLQPLYPRIKTTRSHCTGRD
jgi:hypothetical protein